MNPGDGPLRYSRQTRFAPIGEQGQERLRAGRVAVVGCGALGTVSANLLARAGVGFLRIIDRDVVEFSNLQRQVLFDEADAAAGLAKGDAAVRKLAAVNSEITLEAAVCDLNSRVIDRWLGDVDLVVDGTDNFETRFLLNDYAIRSVKPWIFGAAVGASGQTMTILPGATPCLRCLMEAPPAPGTMATCESAGILAPASSIIASVQAAEAIKLLTSARADFTRGLLVVDVWAGQFRRLNVDSLVGRSDCPTCQRREFPWLDGARGSLATYLCGRCAVQVLPSQEGGIEWRDLKRRVGEQFAIQETPFLFRFQADGMECSVFQDGRAIVKGTEDPAVARSFYARYIGT